MEKEYIQITSGRGPVECCRVVVLVMKKIVEQAKCLNYAVEIVEHEDGPNDGCMFSATLTIEGENIFSLKDEWEGSVLLGGTKESLPSLASSQELVCWSSLFQSTTGRYYSRAGYCL